MFNVEEFEKHLNTHTRHLRNIDIRGIKVEDSTETIQEHIEDVIGEYEIVYYHTAIEWLREYDASLRESLSIADELGFTVDPLSSDLLATLYAQELMREELANIDLNDFVEDADDE